MFARLALASVTALATLSACSREPSATPIDPAPVADAPDEASDAGPDVLHLVGGHSGGD